MAYIEFVEWVAFMEIEPLPEQRADLRNAQAMALLANVNRDPKKGKASEAADFLIDWWKDAPRAEDLRDKFRAMAERINAHNTQVDNAN